MTAAILIFAWLVCGIAACGFAFRTSTFSKAEPAISIVVFLALFLISPAVVIWFLGMSLWLLARGKTPFKKYQVPSAVAEQLPENRVALLCKMISIRACYDEELKRGPPADHWPMFQLSLTPEETLLSAVEMFLWQRDAECPLELDNATLTKPSDAEEVLGRSLQEAILDYASSAMRLRHSSYLSHGAELISEATQYASAWTLKSIASSYLAKPYPPQHWWKDRVELADAKDGRLPPPFEGMALDAIEEEWTRTAQDWRNLQSRAVDDDQLYTFNSASASWQNLGGRAGLVLVRRGRPIANVTLLMN